MREESRVCAALNTTKRDEPACLHTNHSGRQWEQTDRCESQWFRDRGLLHFLSAQHIEVVIGRVLPPRLKMIHTSTSLIGNNFSDSQNHLSQACIKEVFGNWLECYRERKIKKAMKAYVNGNLTQLAVRRRYGPSENQVLLKDETFRVPPLPPHLLQVSTNILVEYVGQ